MITCVPSLEYLSFQDDDTVKTLKQQLRPLLANGVFSTQAVYESGIEKTLRERFKMNIEFSVIETKEANAFAEIPPIKNDHVFRGFTGNPSPDEYGRLLSSFDTKNFNRGSVNIADLTVSGVFTKIPVIVGITTGHLKHPYTDEEIIATILHEIGHIWTTFFYLLHSSLANFITQATAAACVGATSDKTREVILARGYRIMGVDGVGVKEHLHQTQDQIQLTMQTVYINDTMRLLRSETGYGMYEIRCAEQLADVFATRFGLGLANVKQLQKAYRQNWDIIDMHRGRSYMLAGLTALSQLVISPINVFNEIFFTNNRDRNISIYDSPKERIKLIRQSVIEDIKQGKLPDKVTKQLIKQVDEIKIIEENIVEYPSVIQWLKEKFNPNTRRVKENIQIQKDLEELICNDVYLSSKKFELGVKS